MKLYLISAFLLLVPLVTAESLVKFLYSKEGDKDFLITESYNASSIVGERVEWLDGGFVFQIRSYRDGIFSQLVVNGRDFEASQSFAVEAFWKEERTSNKSLRHLIWTVQGPIIIRHLTGEERSQLETYKQQQTEKSNFKVTRKGLHLKTETSGFLRLMTACYPWQDKGNYLFQLEVKDSNYETSKIGLFDKTRDMSFVLEHRPDRRPDSKGRKNRDCANDKMPDLASFKALYCEGEMGIRGLTNED